MAGGITYGGNYTASELDSDDPTKLIEIYENDPEIFRKIIAKNQPHYKLI
ncbi:hypothetical protein [Bartonella apis]|nr:hypothetical protein [Bartonella apis]MCT6880106.1 hypothetical protein [Commensalibacter sp.]OLY46939.1 hypothetical protein PEB0122_022290 [Bartonella apis]